MNTKLFVPAVLAAAIGFTSMSSANAASYAESADTAKNVTVPTRAADDSAPHADDLNAQMTTDVRSTTTPRGAKQDSTATAKARPGPAKMFQLRDAAGG